MRFLCTQTATGEPQMLAVTGGKNSPQSQQLASADEPLSVKNMDKIFNI